MRGAGGSPAKDTVVPPDASRFWPLSARALVCERHIFLGIRVGVRQFDLRDDIGHGARFLLGVQRLHATGANQAPGQRAPVRQRRSIDFCAYVGLRFEVRLPGPPAGSLRPRRRLD